MEFTTPTSLQELYDVLREIFLHFRIRREKYDGITLEMISLERLEETELTDEELKAKATVLLSAEHEKEKTDYKNTILSEIETINKKIEECPKSEKILLDAIIKSYSDSERKIEEQALKNGLNNSSIVIDKICVLEQTKNAEMTKVKTESEKTLSDLNARLIELESKIDNVEDYFKALHDKAIEVKVVELKDKQIEKKLQAFKFNSNQNEKEQRYANEILKTNASFQMRFLELSTDEFTKDQLVEMGYYEAVIRCAGGYFNTLDPTSAYNTIKSEPRLGIYLEDYYDNFIAIYRNRANS